MTYPTPANNYAVAVGTDSTAPFITIIMNRAPTGNDGPTQRLLVGQRWVDTANENAEYFLLNYTSSNGLVQANWVQLGAGAETVETLTGNSGPPVPPTAGNINVLGTGAVTTTGSGSTLTIAISGGGGFTWHNITAASATLAAQNGYVADRGTLITFTLPTNNALGDTIILMGLGLGGWEIVYGTGQYIIFGDGPTTTTTGNLASSNQYDCCILVCTVPSATAPIFQVLDSIGNLQVT